MNETKQRLSKFTAVFCSNNIQKVHLAQFRASRKTGLFPLQDIIDELKDRIIEKSPYAYKRSDLDLVGILDGLANWTEHFDTEDLT